MTPRRMSYHSMHAYNSYRESHRLFDGGVDQYQLVESRFGPLAVVGLENIVAFFSELFDEVCSIGRVEQVNEGVRHCLLQTVSEVLLEDRQGRTMLVVWIATMFSARMRRQMISTSRSTGLPFSRLSSMTHCRASF
jgi:hypothetical protein